ncbi:hypothetical protein PMAC_002559 [Pneumocystis sp. 'macacae']|nr:hypothetical protein PMAC_002559 [Pneumocystis sp. 'macacae']
MRKAYEKEHESFENNVFYDRENETDENRGEKYSFKRRRSLSHQSYLLDKHNQRFDLTCPNTVPQGLRYSYTPLYQQGRRKSMSSSFSSNYYSEESLHFPLYQTHNHCLDFDFSEQIKNNNTHKSNKYEKDMNRNEYKKHFSCNQPHLTNNVFIHKYHDQSFNSYIHMESSETNGTIGETVYYKNIPKGRDLDKEKSLYEKNAIKELSLFEYEKNDNYSFKVTSIDNSIIREEERLFLKESVIEKNDLCQDFNNVCTIPFNSSNSLDKSLEGEKDISKSLQERPRSMDLKTVGFKDLSLFNSYTINDNTISRDFSIQNDKKLIQNNIYDKIEEVDKKLLTCEGHFYEIKNKKLQTIDSNNESEKEMVSSVSKFTESLPISDLLYLETNLYSKIYSENKEKAKQNCIKFSYIKLYNDSLKEYPFFKENELKHERLRPLLFLYILKKNKRILKKNKILQLQYEKYQNSWKSQVERLDNIKKTKKQENERFGFSDTHLDNLSLRSFRRGQGLNYGDFVRSDADFEDIVAKLGVEDDRISRAAVIPPMISDLSETIKYQYNDRNGIVQDPISSFHYPTWINIWTVEEHELFKQLFIKYPQKNFGLIASSIPNKTISQCVLHYYRTKKQENYKNLVISKNSDRAKRKGRGRSSKKMEKVKASSLLADLQPNVANDDIDDD